MYNFIVLGLVPGTDIRISFQAWVIFSMAFWAGFIIARLQMKQRAYFVRLNHVQHMRIHASQLHQRAI